MQDFIVQTLKNGNISFRAENEDQALKFARRGGHVVLRVMTEEEFERRQGTRGNECVCGTEESGGRMAHMELPDAFPEQLREAAKQYLTKNEGSRLLTTRRWENQRTGSCSFRVYIEWGNLMTSLYVWGVHGSVDDAIGVCESHMIVGDMKVFMEEDPVWFR